MKTIDVNMNMHMCSPIIEFATPLHDHKYPLKYTLPEAADLFEIFVE